MKLVLLNLFIFSFFICGFAQQKTSLDDLRSLYQSFEYNKVITLSDSILSSKDTLNNSELTEILLMKAVSHYALDEEPQVRKCFIDILKINRDYVPDSDKVSPKIVSLFTDVKNDFLHTITVEQKSLSKNSEQLPVQSGYDLILDNAQIQKNSIVRSFLFPGWGQLYSGNITKGSIISSAALINLGAMIYFIIHTNTLDKNYNNETDESLIPSQYNSYNKSFKIRNILISSFILIYAYAQIDLLILDVNNLPQIRLGLAGNSLLYGDTGFRFSMKYSF
jgi:TM2 domain-containing membrane protein YozV